MSKVTFPVQEIWVVGCGGVGSYLIPPLLKMLRAAEDAPRVILCDADTVELRNLDRQLFTNEDIGENKAEVLVKRYAAHYPPDKLTAVASWFTSTTPVSANPLIICCVDNHAARRACLARADAYSGAVILAANEYVDADAQYYEGRWRDTPLDPRVRWPVILTDDGNDPARPRGCTGHIVEAASPQLAMANFAAANFALWLFWYHYVERFASGYNTAEFRPHWPMEHRMNISRTTTLLVRDIENSVAAAAA